MSTLPVRKTAWRGIIFPFTHFMPLARRLGLTIAIGAGVLALQMFVLPSMLLAGSLSFEALTLANLVFLPVYLVLYLNLFAGPVQVAIGVPEARKLFGLGKPELLFAGFLLLLFCALMVAYIPVLIVIAGTGALFSQTGGDTGSAIVISLILLIPVLVAFMVWFTVRLLPAYGVIAEQKRLGLAEAWRMSKGKWWRIFGTVLLVSLCYGLVLAPVYFMWAQALMPQILQLVGQTDMSPAMQMASMTKVQASLWPLFVAQWIIALGGLVAYGGVIGFIYTALKDQAGPASSVTTSDA